MNILDMFIRGVPFAVDKAREVIADSKMVAALKQQARAWASRVVDLHNRRVPSGPYATEKTRLLSQAKTINTAVEKIFGKMAELNQPGLGVVALVVPLAVVTAAAAAMTKWTYDYLTLTKKLDEYNKMVSSGVSPVTAGNLVEQVTDTASFFSPVKTMTRYAIPLLIIGGVAFFMYSKRKGK